MKIIGIYKITSPSGKVYIGQSKDIETRWKSYRGMRSCGNKLRSSFKSHSPESHTFEVLEECKIEELNQLERHYQDLYDVLGPNGLNLKLTNLTDSNGPLSKETKDRISNTLKGRKRTTSSVAKQVATITGRTRPVEFGEKISKKLKGRVFSKDWGDKISKANTGRLNNNGKSVINTETGEIFDAVKRAAASIGMRHVSLNDRLKGRVKNDTNFKYYIEE